MSAPDTNLNKQAKRHRGPLLGIIAAVVVAGILLLWLLTDTFSDTTGGTDDTTTQQIDSGGIPAEGAPSTSMGTGTDAPQVIESQPTQDAAPGAAPEASPQTAPLAAPETGTDPAPETAPAPTAPQ